MQRMVEVKRSLGAALLAALGWGCTGDDAGPEAWNGLDAADSDASTGEPTCLSDDKPTLTPPPAGLQAVGLVPWSDHYEATGFPVDEG